MLTGTAVASCIASFLVFSETYIGKQPHLSFTINPAYFLHYFSFFIFGWISYTVNFDFNYLKFHAGWLLFIGLVLTPVRLMLSSFPGTLLFGLMVVAYNISLWCYIFGLIGIGQRFFSKHSYRLKYISESSYWVYLIHMPIILTLKITFFANHSFIVFLFLFSLVFYLCLTSYHYLIRPTAIGHLLNGKKYKVYPLFERNVMYNFFYQLRFVSILKRFTK
jgi:hypothetical protein